MVTKPEIMEKGRAAMEELASRPRKPPQTASEAILVIEEMRRHTKSRAARVRMAEMAIRIGNITPAAKDVWATYLTQEK